MSQASYELKAEARERVGKGSARAIRRNGKIPAVIYGGKEPPLSITLSYKDIYYKIHGGGFMTTLASIDIDGEKIRVLPKEYQLDPVRGFPMHVDFLRIGRDSIVTVAIPVRFENEEQSPGIKRGGVLNIVRHEIEAMVPATSIPDVITVDLTGLDIGDAVHISRVELPDDVKPVIADRDFTIATVVAPAGLQSEEDEAAEAEAGESPEEG